MHAEFQEAQQRLEESHREKVTRVMKDWSDLEEKYQDMRMADPKSAQTFKQRMTARFQVKLVSLLSVQNHVIDFPLKNKYQTAKQSSIQSSWLH